ncbi:MAG TPA: DUF2993 domain-containing protein [Candidatus Dormibacteraeota bacterium]|nr:DUF2993 domain-containing protein [Candidatus Dormibacteraeota bacterium]
MRTLIATLVVLCLLLIAADRIGEWEAGKLIASHVTSTYNLSQKPKVEVRGTPFLTQWAEGDYREVDVQAPTLTVDKVPINDVRVQIHDIQASAFVTTAAGFESAGAGRVAMQGQIPYSGLPAPSGFTITPSDGELKLQGSIGIYGVTIPVSATIAVGVQNGRLVLTAQKVQASNAYVDSIAQQLIQRQLDQVPQPQDLPFGAHLTGVQVTSNALDIEASGRNVTLAGT